MSEPTKPKISLKAEIECISYRVPLTAKQWKSLNRISEKGDDRATEVIGKLTYAGANERSIEYNGHFGRNIFFSVTNAGRLPRVIAAIKRIVK